MNKRKGSSILRVDYESAEKNDRYSTLEREDPKVQHIDKVVTQLQEVQPFFGDFIKALQSFTALGEKWVWSGNVLQNSLNKIAQHQKGGEYGEGLKCANEGLKAAVDFMAEFSRTFADKVQTIWSERELSSDKAQLTAFDKSFKRTRDISVKNIRKAEAVHAKAAKSKAKKKNPDAEVAAKQALKEAAEEHDAMLSTQLRTVTLLERKKYSFFVKQLDSVLTSSIESGQLALNTMTRSSESLQQYIAAEQEENWPDELKELIGEISPVPMSPRVSPSPRTRSLPNCAEPDEVGTKEDGADIEAPNLNEGDRSASAPALLTKHSLLTPSREAEQAQLKSSQHSSSVSTKDKPVKSPKLLSKPKKTKGAKNRQTTTELPESVAVVPATLHAEEPIFETKQPPAEFTSSGGLPPLPARDPIPVSPHPDKLLPSSGREDEELRHMIDSFAM